MRNVISMATGIVIFIAGLVIIVFSRPGTMLTAITGGSYNYPYTLLAPILGRYAKKNFGVT